MRKSRWFFLLGLTFVMILYCCVPVSAALPTPGHSDQIRNLSVQKLALSSPVGGESWKQESSQKISWTFTGAATDKITIQLFQGPSLIATLATSIPVGLNGSGAFTWNITDKIPAGSNYHVVIVSESNNSVAASSNVFSVTAKLLAIATQQPGLITNVHPVSLAAISVTKPEAGDSLQMGRSYTVSWKPNVNPNLSGPVDVLLLSGGQPIKYLTNGAPVTGSYTWKIDLLDPYISSGNKYTIQVATQKDKNLQGTSSQFSIVKPEIIVTSPETWKELKRGQSVQINWKTTGDCGANADIYLTYWSNLVIFDTIAASVSLSQGSFMWTIPAYTDEKIAEFHPWVNIAVQAKDDPDLVGSVRVTVK